MKRKRPSAVPPRRVSPKERRRLLASIMNSPTYRKAYQDKEFLGTEELRPVRLELELLKPELQLTKLDIRSTVVVFGSARIHEPGEARRRLTELRREAAKRPRDAALKRRVGTAERLLELSRYYDEARRFARLISEAGQNDGMRDYVVVTGGGPGIMEAANRGPWEAGAKSIGLNITLPHEQEPNPYMTPELSFRFHYFAIRKMHFLMRCRAMVAFPGGFGTMDELFETLTLVQTQKKKPIPILLFGREYWSKVINLNYMAYAGVISHDDLDLIRYVETAEEAVAAIRSWWESHGGLKARRRRSIRSMHENDD